MFLFFFFCFFCGGGLFQSFLGGLFGPVCDIDVVLNDAESRKTAELKTEDGKVEKHYLFYDGESVSGKVSHCLVSSLSGKKKKLMVFLWLMMCVPVHLTR